MERNRMDAAFIAEETLAAALRHALRENLFTNRMRIAPRRLSEIEQDEVKAFYSFCETGNQQAAIERGRNLAHEGLGRSSVLTMTSALRRTFWGLDQSVAATWLDKVEGYPSALLDGYI